MSETIKMRCKKCSNTHRNKVEDFTNNIGKLFKTCNWCRARKKERCPHEKFKQYCVECKGGSLCYKNKDEIIRKDQCDQCRRKVH